ncbi:MAG: hypothetical protein R3232_08070 [Clostridia bacterium]|jgi:hypothetical protein|nr:hypothetical protein [Clostridia bacterium]
MDITVIVGLSVIGIAYLLIWAFTLRANKIINKIEETGITDSRDIEKTLDL